MKKFVYIIISLLLSLSFISNVNAQVQRKFVKSWETNPMTTTYIEYTNNYSIKEFGYIIYSNYSKYKDGYITSYEVFDKVDGWTTQVTYYDELGNVIKTKNDYEFAIDEIIVNGDYIYALAYNSDTSVYHIVKIDSNLEVVKDKIVDSFYRSNYAWEEYKNKYFGTDFIYIIDNELVIYSGSYYYTVDLDLNNDVSYSYAYSKSEKTESMSKSLMTSFYRTFGNEIIYAFPSVNKVGDKSIVSGAFYPSTCDVSTETCNTKMFVQVWEPGEPFTKVNEIIRDDYLEIHDVQLTNNYYVGIGTKVVGEEEKNVILIFDIEGNLFQEIISDRTLMRLVAYDDSFLVTSYGEEDSDGLTSYQTEVYQLGYNIKVNVAGNGTLAPSKVEAINGDVVKYIIKPEEGYLIEKLSVSTVSGKKIEVNDNSFIMPDEDVIIDVSFVKMNNPQTGISNYSILLYISLLGIIFIICNKDRFTYFNKIK